MGVKHTKPRVSPTGEMAHDDLSDVSVELGEPYDRIEYPRDVYDRVCGRVPAKPQAKKKKVDERLSDSESSQTTLSESEAPSIGRKRKKKQLPFPYTVKAKKSTTTGTEVAQKSSKSNRVRREERVESEDGSDYEMEVEKDEDDSEVDSSVQKKKQKKSDSKGKQAGMKKREKKRSRIEKAKESKENIETLKNNEEKSRSKEDEKKERKENDVKKEKRKEPKENEDGGGKSHSKRDEKKERKEIDVKKEKKRERSKDKEEREDSHKPKRDEKKERKDIGQNKEKTDTPKNEEGKREKSLSKQDERKERKVMEDPRKEKNSSMEGKKSTGHLEVEVSSNPQQPDNRCDFVVPASSPSFAVPPPPPLKSILKKPGAIKSNSSDNSVLPSCMQQLFKDAPSSSFSPSTAFLAAFKVPKKKDTGDDRLGSNKKQSVAPTEVDNSDDKEEGRNGWDPRNDAFRPPPRNFGKPPPKPTVETRRLSDSLKPREPHMITPRRTLLGPYPGANVEENNYEDWEAKIDIPPIGSFSPPSMPIVSPTPLDMGGDASLPVLPPLRLAQSSTMITPSSLNKKTLRGEGGRSSTPRHSHMQKWTAKREAEHAMVHSSSGWSFDSKESTEPRRREGSRWDEYSSPDGGKTDDKRHFVLPVNTPVSPSPSDCSSFSFNRPPQDPQPTPIPIETKKDIRYRFIPIDDECLPLWNRSDRFKSTSAKYAAHSLNYQAIVVAGPFPERVDKKVFEKMMKERGADVEWTEAPATNDTAAMEQRSIAAVLCYSEALAKVLAAEGTAKVESAYVSFGRPLEVLVKVEGLSEKMKETDLIKEMTDTIETNIGGLVELILFPTSNDLEVEGKARFFHAVHGTRAANSAPLSLRGGLSISFSPCSPDKSTVWMAEIHSNSSCEDVESAKLLSTAGPRAIPLYSVPHISPFGPQPVPPPSIVPLSTIPATIRSIKIVKEPSDYITPSTTVSDSTVTLSSSAMSLETSEEEMSSSSISVPSHHHSKFSSLPPPTAIPPPGLVDPSTLHITTRAELYEKTISIPAISVPAGIIPLPPTRIPPPKDVVPILPYPNLPRIEHQFFPAPPPPRRKTGGQGMGQLQTVDPATFIRPFKALLPKKMKEEQRDEEYKIEDEILLFARPEDPQTTPEWDAVRSYFKDEDCSSRVYGGIVSLRFTGGKAREKAQVLLLDAPHTVNGQKFTIGLTFSVLYEASKAVGKTILYEELTEKFGSVVEVEKKCDTPSGKPVYKIYFDSLEIAQKAAVEGITVGESTLTNIGRIPV